MRARFSRLSTGPLISVLWDGKAVKVGLARLKADPDYIDGILADGAARARAIAGPIMDEVRDVVGLLRPGAPRLPGSPVDGSIRP